jgi:uncharacterized protein (DUF58 family)
MGQRRGSDGSEILKTMETAASLSRELLLQGSRVNVYLNDEDIRHVLGHSRERWRHDHDRAFNCGRRFSIK